MVIRKRSDITEKYISRTYEDLLVRSRVSTVMLANGRIAPRLAFSHGGLFIDSEEAYSESKEWYEKQKVSTAANADDSGGRETSLNNSQNNSREAQTQ